MHTLRQYLFTLSDLRGLARTLGEAEVCRDAAGRPEYAVGNSAAVFRIRHAGRIRSLPSMASSNLGSSMPVPKMNSRGCPGRDWSAICPSTVSL